MENLRKLPVYLFAALAMGFASCDSDDPAPENEDEVITDVTLTFQEINASGSPVGTPVSFTASDDEGIEVGGAPTIETVTLTRGKNYILAITVFNSIKNEDITAEILEEAAEHQFYFLGSAFTGNIMTISYADPNGVALGVVNRLNVSSSPGTNNTQMRVILRHDLDKNFPGANNPNFANYAQAGGSSDLDITFPVVIN
jgi:hypothetical protein